MMINLVEQIQTVLGKRDGISDELMRPLADAYAVEVARVNDRLSAAVALLRKGLRSEAIQSVSITPNAIDDAAKLDFPDNEREDWHDILQFLDIPVPPDVRRDLVEQVNEAIVETQPLESLLRRHRRLAIARAPLAWRLKVLRRIADIDVAGTMWEDDIEAWEKVRHKQLSRDVANALASGRTDDLRPLHDELTNSAWRIAPDRTLAKQINASLVAASRAENLAELQELAPQLNDAFCQFDETAARRLATEWHRATGLYGIALPDELSEQVEPAIMWLAEIDREAEARARRGVALGALESALDRKASLDDLERAYQQATLFDEPPPETLVQRYWVATEERKLASTRRFQIIVAAVLSACVLGSASLAWWQIKSAYDQRVASAENQFRSLVDAGDLESATSFYESLKQVDADVATTSGITSLAGQLDSKIGEGQKRAEQFADYLKQADAEADADIDIAALNRAEAIASTEEQRGRVYAMQRRATEWENKLITQQTASLNEKLATVRSQLDEIESGDPDSAASSQLTGLVEQLQRIGGEFPRATSAAKGQATSLRTRAVSMRTAIADRSQRMQLEDAAIKRIVESQSLDEFAAALKTFASRLPNSPLADEFARAAGERDVWNKGLNWNEYVVSLGRWISGGYSAELMKSVQSSRLLVNEQIDQSPMSLPASLRERIERFDERSEILKRVLGELPNTVIADLFTVIGNNGSDNRYFTYKTYYDGQRASKFANSDRPLVGQVGIEVVTNDSGAVGVKSMSHPLIVHKEPFGTIDSLMTKYQTRHDAILSDWDGEFLKLVADVTKRPNLDSMVKEMLIQHLISGACEGSEFLSNALVNELRMLKSRSADVALWYEPKPPTDKVDETMEAGLTPTLSRLYRERSTPQSELASIKDSRFRLVGFLTRKSNGEIVMKTFQKPPTNGPLAIVRPSEKEPDRVDWVAVGTIQGGQATLSGKRDDMIAGRPVFSYYK